MQQSGRAKEMGFKDRHDFFLAMAEGHALDFKAIVGLVVYKRSRKPVGKYKNEAGFRVLFQSVRAARFVFDLTEDWGADYILRKDKCDAEKQLLVLSGPFQHVVSKDGSSVPWLSPSNTHSTSGPYFCTQDDVGESLSTLTLSHMPRTALGSAPEPVLR